MTINRWKHNIEELNLKHDLQIIDNETYKTHLFNFIYKLYKHGGKEDAEKCARAHCWKIKDIIEYEGIWNDYIKSKKHS